MKSEMQFSTRQSTGATFSPGIWKRILKECKRYRNMKINGKPVPCVKSPNTAHIGLSVEDQSQPTS